jgi:putative pyruvate formate lyase activating enzyme
MSVLNDCRICPRLCGVDRRTQTGYCRAGIDPIVNLAMLHHGEEPAISGTRGSGTIFFSHCNLRCVYCQNYKISQLGQGEPTSVGKLAEMMLELQSQGAHNVNLVTGTHFTPQIREALLLAKELGLEIPIVWNSSGYELPDTLAEFESLVDIYLPDYRYAGSESAQRCSDAPDYPQAARLAIREMLRQVGHLRCDDDGIAQRGLLIRLLVLPGDSGDIGARMQWIADSLGIETYISLMSQYYPAHRALLMPPLDRGLNPGEYRRALDKVEELGLERGYFQELAQTPDWTPDFS